MENIKIKTNSKIKKNNINTTYNSISMTLKQYWCTIMSNVNMGNNNITINVFNKYIKKTKIKKKT